MSADDSYRLKSSSSIEVQPKMKLMKDFEGTRAAAVSMSDVTINKIVNGSHCRHTRKWREGSHRLICFSQMKSFVGVFQWFKKTTKFQQVSVVVTRVTVELEAGDKISRETKSMMAGS
ncbi:hypothetical protein AVEN_238731-1 [Araneus ventricosus]|uniref:Uncharacterized protein n=1 Tax=Araneus ventricosus TaxID=182803 RepID=A0A4Y2GFZ3_ARAVE|nr:hypothetical protein AVEN_238731-1 [Araneus ventricosus]